MFIHPGFYCRQDDQTTIMANVLIGWINEINGEGGPDINTLDHKEPESLLEAELQERRDFIEESHKLKENKILNERLSAKEEIIQMFLRNWGAGRTDLEKFSIELLPNSQPVQAKTRPSNPFQ